MALSREQARPREHHELRRYLRFLSVGDQRIPGRLVEEALDLWAEVPHASVDNILWATLRHVAGDPGTLRSKVEVRAKRNTAIDWVRIRTTLDEVIPAGLGHTITVERVLAVMVEALSGPAD